MATAEKDKPKRNVSREGAKSAKKRVAAVLPRAGGGQTAYAFTPTDASRAAHANGDAPGRLATVPLVLIDEDVPNHRGKPDAAALAELAASIRQYGLRQPIEVVEKPGGRYTLVYGFRRRAAAEQLGHADIAAFVYAPLPDPRANRLRIVQLQAIENLQRKDLTPLEEALACAALVETKMAEADGTNFEAAVERAAAQTGRSVPWVRQRCRLLRLGEKVRALVQQGKILLGHANLLARLGDERDQMDLSRYAVVDSDEGRTHCTLPQLARLVSDRLTSLRGVPWRLDQPFAGKPACADCQHNSDNQQTLFGDGDEQPKGRCLLPRCYEAKLKTAGAAREKAMEKLADGGVTEAETVAAVVPDFLKPEPIVRKAREAIHAEQLGKAAKKEAGKEAKSDGKNTADRAEEKYYREYDKWERQVAELVSEAAGENPVKFVSLCLLYFHPAHEDLDAHRGRSANEKARGLLQPYFDALPFVLRAEEPCKVLAELAENVIGAIKKDGLGKFDFPWETQRLDGFHIDALEGVAKAWGLELPPKPVKPDPKKQRNGDA